MLILDCRAKWQNRKRASLPALLLLWLICGLLVAQNARADRVVLAPDGTTLGPNGVKAEFAISPYRRDENRSWFQFTTTEGIEFEFQRFALAEDSKSRTSLSLQYPFLIDLGAVPAISFGVRDLFGTGVEHHSLYASFSKTLPLSSRQLRWLREFKWSAGAGTERIGGLFAGVQARFAGGFSLSAEIYRQRPNIGIAFPLVRNLQARAYSLDGTIHYGLSYTWTH